MYGSSYMFRHYIAILGERFQCLLRDAQLRSSRQNIVDGRVVSSDVVHAYINEMQGSRSKIPSKISRQAALRGGI
jgi:hypothetical protein